ncbi:MAG: hypothetical protein KC609_03630 [Myxococcales bacterium]|nr:hypothetical protein [Myxococcales bacterium]
MEWLKKNAKWLVLVLLLLGVLVGVTIYYKMFRRDPVWVEQQRNEKKKLDDLDRLLDKQGDPNAK